MFELNINVNMSEMLLRDVDNIFLLSNITMFKNDNC